MTPGIADRTGRLRWLVLAAVLAIAGIALLVDGCTADKSGPPMPPPAASGNIDGGSSTAASPSSPVPSPKPVRGTVSGPATTTQPVEPPPSRTPGSTARPNRPVPPSAPGSTTTRITAPTTAATSASITGPVLSASPPVSLSIPAIGVRSPVIRLGLEPDGTIEVPSLDDPHSPAGWYQGSPSPGQVGPSIILGHIDSRAYGPGVFYRLGDLRPGDTVKVTRTDGTVAVFRIGGVRRYPKDDFPTLTVYGNIDHAGLRLITCGGAFDDDSGHYQDNIIAFGSLVTSHRADR